MEDLAARSRFLFGVDVPPDDIGVVYPSLDDDDPGALDLDPSLPAWQLMRRVAAEQVLADIPPDTWVAAQRLVEAGLDRHEALDQLARGLFYGLAEEVMTARDARRAGKPERATPLAERMGELFEHLPLPSEADVLGAIRRVVGGEQGIVESELLPRVVADLGLDDPVGESQARLVLHRAIEQGYPLAPLPDGRIVDRAALAASVVLTHRLTAAEVAADELRLVLSDLCLFADEPQPELESGVELEHIDSGGGPAWSGPAGWLDTFRSDRLVAVRCRYEDDGKRVFALEPIDSAETLPWLVPAIRAAFDTESDIEGAAIPIAAIIARVAIDRPEAFAAPRDPVTELAAAAGLEVRGSYVGTETRHWRGLWEQERHERLNDLTDDEDLLDDAFEVLFDLEADDSAPDDLRSALRRLHSDDQLAELVISELAPADHEAEWIAGPVPLATIASRAIDAARRSDETCVAHYLAGSIAERTGDAVVAEEHFRAGYAADYTYAPVVDRCAWYASDRGDAEAASRLWRSLADPPTDELETLTPYLARSDRKLGRNDPCWCGSGRKFKACHQRQPEQHALPARLPWLCRKASSYLFRHEGGAKRAIVANVLALADGDDAAVMTAARDPLVADAALHEGGWFDRFLAERGPLLPDDEQLLAASWALVERTVYEVIAVDPGRGLELRDLRTGEDVSVSERALTRVAGVGSLWCARAVADGSRHQIIGGVFPVAPGQERIVLDLCDRRDPIELCRYVASTRRPAAHDNI